MSERELLVGRARTARNRIGRSVGRSVGRHHHHHALKIQVALLLLVMVSPLWVMPLSAPVVSDVVVVMHHDSAVNTAVRTITENVPDVQVLEYGSLEYALTIHRTVGRVVWVSHGSEEGILAGSQSISWKAFSGTVKMTPGRDIVLACNSEELNKYVSTNLAIGFKGIVDAILGGLFVSYLLRFQDVVATALFRRMLDISSGSTTPSLLAPTDYVIGYLSECEAIYWLAISTLVIMSILFNYYNSDLSFWMKVACLLYSAGLCGILVTGLWYWRGWMDPLTAATKIVSFILGTVIGLMIKVLTDFGDPIAWAIFSACVLVTITAWVGSAGLVAAAKIAAALISGIVFIAGLATDYLDTNTFVG